MSSHVVARIGLVALLACAVLTTAGIARGVDVEMTSSTGAQGYAVRSPFGEPILMRRRFLQTLGLNVTNVEGAQTDPDAPQISFRMRLRLDADFGINPEELRGGGQPLQYVPGLEQAPIDLMYGYLDARNLARGLLSVRLGRQYVIDSLGWWSFDGVLSRVELPAYIAFETYGGFEQRGGLPLSTPRFERDGVWRGDRTGMEAARYPDYLQAGAAPAYGAMVETFRVKHLHLRGAYRRVWNTGEVSARAIGLPAGAVPLTWSGMRMSSERLGASADLMFEQVGDLRAGMIYDLYSSVMSSYYASLDAFPTRWLTVGTDADRFVPTFDADSIFNWFAHYPMTTWTGRAEATITRQVDLAASGGVRWVETSADPATYTPGSQGSVSRMADVLGRVSARHRVDSGVAGTSALMERGERGRREGVDLYADRWLQQRYLLRARVSLYDWTDNLRPDRSATSFGYVLGGGIRPGPLTNVLVEWEHDTNRLVGQRYRIMAWLNMVVTK
jgi:hypothetical protein